MSDWNKQIIDEFRANDGRVGGPFEGKTLLLLHTIGAKSGKERVNPVATFEDNGRLVVIASKGGAPTNPDWYYNIVAHPDVEVEYGTDRFAARATVTNEPERTELYGKMEKAFSGFSGVQGEDRVGYSGDYIDAFVGFRICASPS
ncbi:MAG: nitroreductase/quinone reductase family protein [Chloroflexota bacterium]